MKTNSVIFIIVVLGLSVAIQSVFLNKKPGLGGKPSETGEGKPEEGKGKPEEGKGKSEEGKGKSEEGKGKPEEGKGKPEEDWESSEGEEKFDLKDCENLKKEEDEDEKDFKENQRACFVSYCQDKSLKDDPRCANKKPEWKSPKNPAHCEDVWIDHEFYPEEVKETEASGTEEVKSTETDEHDKQDKAYKECLKTICQVKEFSEVYECTGSSQRYLKPTKPEHCEDAYNFAEYVTDEEGDEEAVIGDKLVEDIVDNCFYKICEKPEFVEDDDCYGYTRRDRDPKGINDCIDVYNQDVEDYDKLDELYDACAAKFPDSGEDSYDFSYLKKSGKKSRKN